MNDNNLIIKINEIGITTIILNRPEKNNAFDNDLIKNLIQQLKKISNNPKIRVVILKGAGKNFCAGADIAWMQRMKNFSKEENFHDAEQLAKLFYLLNNLNKPTIALIQGAVAGGGNGLVACCDISIAAHDAMFCFSEVKLGILPASIAPYVIAAIGTRAARRYFLTAERFNAEEAMRINLIHKIVDQNQLESAGNEMANLLLQNGPKALTIAKQLIHRCSQIDNSLIKETVELIANIRVSDEAQEGLQAFLEKRKPKWT